MPYLTSIEAPTPSKDALIDSASSLGIPSLTGQGAPSTSSLASFKPKPRRFFTSLTTLSLPAPAEVKITLN